MVAKKTKREKVPNYIGVYRRPSTIRKHNGKPDICYYITYKLNDKKVWEKVGWTSQGVSPAYAKQIRDDRTGKIWRDEEVIPTQKKRKNQTTFKVASEKYLAWAENNKKDHKHDETRYRLHLAPLLDNKLLKEITPELLEQLKENLFTKNLSPATVKHCLVLVRMIFNKVGPQCGFQGVNPVKQIKLPKLDNRRLRYLTVEEATELLSELKSHNVDIHDQALLSLHCGLRFGEIAGLVWGVINFTNNIITVKDPKNEETRQAYMTDDIRAMLISRKTKESHRNQLIFPGKNGEAQTEVSSTYSYIVDKLGLNENVNDRRDKVVFHTLRHTFASWLAEQGTPLYTIKELMGHKTLAMTERYAHLIPDVKREAVLAMAEKFNKTNKKQ